MEAFRGMVKGWLGKGILGLIVFGLAAFGLESYFGNGGKVIAAKVNGKEILQPEVDQLVDRQRQQMLAQMGDKADPASLDMARLRKDVLNGVISRELLTQQAKKAGYLISDATVYRLIRQVSAFQEDGRFSQSRYEQMLRQIGESPVTYPAKAKQELAYSMLIAGIGQSGFVTTAELDHLSALDSQKRDIHLAMIPAVRYLSDLAISDEEVKKFYQANPARFTTQEMVSLDYLSIKREDFIAQAVPTEDDLKARYEEKVKSSVANEQRQAQHILITVDAKTKDADALKKMQDIAKRAQAGEDFGKLAKEFSQDPGSVATGGDLGMTARGQFVPEFDKALFSMKEGQMSAPVKTQYGYHLIKLNKIQAAVAPSYVALKPELEREAKEAKADELYAEQIDKLDAAVYEASDLKEPAEKFKYAIASTDAFSRSGGAGLAADRKVLDAAFSDDLLKDGKNSQGIALADGSTVWLRVKNHEPARLKPLAEITASVRNNLLIEKAGAKAKTVADAVAKALAGGKTLAEIAATEKLTWQDMPDATRRTPVPLPEILRVAYRLPRPAAGKVSADSFSAGASYVVVAVSKVTEGTTLPGADGAQMRNVLSENRSQQEFQDYIRSLRESGKVVVLAKDSAVSEE